ncbi:MAG TPA: ABC transporter permease [Flavobacteriaceae bacterium]|nr:ABC transporter permease [Flavobacteriaceae bacterium]
MNHLSLIIKREYLTKVRNKSFIVMTILSPLIMIALIAVVAYLSQLNNNKHRTIAVLDESGFVSDVLKSTDHVTYDVLQDMSLDDAIAQVKAKEEYGLLYVPGNENIEDISGHIRFYSEDSPSLTIISDLEGRLEQRLTDEKLQLGGVDLNKIKMSKTNVSIAQETFTGETSSKIDNILKLSFGGISGYLLFMFIIIYGNMIMRSVIEEKTSRIIEVIISSVKPIQLMMGKIIGTSLAGITQFVVWTILGGVALVILNSIFGISFSSQPEMMQQAAQHAGNSNEVQMVIEAFYNLPIANLIVAFMCFFLGGYLLYSSLYAAIGAAVDNETDTQQFVMPILMPLILAVYVGVFTVIEDPHGTVSTVFSFIPFTSPVVMLMRIPFGVPMWQQLLSLGLLIGTFMFTVWFAAKIYRVGILMYGKKPTYKELFKWLKY